MLILFIWFIILLFFECGGKLFLIKNKINLIRVYLKNFWRYQTNIERGILLISIILIILSFYISKYIVLFSLLLGFSINYIVSIFHSFEKDKNILIERRGYLNFMMNIYNNPATGGIKKIITNIKPDSDDSILNHGATISNNDASNLKEYLNRIKELVNNLNNNKSLTWDEKCCLHVLISRIDNFIDNNKEIPILKEGIIYVIFDIKINTKWLFDIPYIFESEKISFGFNKTTIEEMFNKYEFDN
jgi:hypothetical protein